MPFHCDPGWTGGCVHARKTRQFRRRRRLQVRPDGNPPWAVRRACPSAGTLAVDFSQKRLCPSLCDGGCDGRGRQAAAARRQERARRLLTLGSFSVYESGDSWATARPTDASASSLENIIAFGCVEKTSVTCFGMLQQFTYPFSGRIHSVNIHTARINPIGIAL